MRILHSYLQSLHLQARLRGTIEVGEYEFNLFVRGHHVYYTSWTPYIGKVLFARRENDNDYDRFSVAIVKEQEVVGHVPRRISNIIFFFLGYDENNIVSCEITGQRINHGAGLEIEVPCVYRFHGHGTHITRSQEFLE